MGLAMHELLLLRRLSAEMGGSLGEVLTIGRQWLIVEHEQVASIVGKPVAPSKFADNTLAALGATRVSALDVSDYEGAEIVHDLNLPYAGGRQFDCVIDFGSLEHVFDMPTALRTLVRLTRPNGAILHVLPGNNLLSHGFWQVSSDLFLEFYCPANGFDNTEVFYASNLDTRTWWQVPRSRPGERREIASMEPVIVLCKAIKTREVEAFSSVQQPFYRQSWETKTSVAPEARGKNARSLSTRLRKIAAFENLYRFARNAYHLGMLASGRSPYGLNAARFRKIRTGL